MKNLQSYFNKLYRDFNNRNIDRVIDSMTEDVKWANGMEGGYVHGKDEVRAYWKRQFESVSSNVSPLSTESTGDWVRVVVHQVVHDRLGQLLSDITVKHKFKMSADKVAEFHIEPN